MMLANSNNQGNPNVARPQVSELADILKPYDEQITKLFGQVLTIYAGPSANTLDEKQKKEQLRRKLEQSLQP